MRSSVKEKGIEQVPEKKVAFETSSASFLIRLKNSNYLFCKIYVHRTFQRPFKRFRKKRWPS